MKEVVIVSGARTPIGTFGATLKDVPAFKLGALGDQGIAEAGGIKAKVGTGTDEFCARGFKRHGNARSGKESLRLG